MDYLRRIERELDLPPAEKQQALTELRAHFEDIKNELVSKGADVEEAKKEAAKRLGSPESIAAGLGAVHMRDGWKSALLAPLPFLAAIPIWMMKTGITHTGGAEEQDIIDLNVPLVLVGGSLLILFGVAMLLIGICQLRHDKRPMWLAPFLAVGLAWPFGFVLNLEAQYALTTGHVERYSGIETPRGMIMMGTFWWIVISSGLLIACSWMQARRWSLPAIGLAVRSRIKYVLAGFLALLLVPFLLPPLCSAWPPLGHAAYLAFGASFALMPLTLGSAAGLVVFARHPHSAPSRASLFFFAGYAFAIMLLLQSDTRYGSIPLAMTVISAVVTMLVYSRFAERRIKYGSLFMGAAVIAAASWLVWQVWAGIFLVVASVPMLIPAAIEFRRERVRNTMIAD